MQTVFEVPRGMEAFEHLALALFEWAVFASMWRGAYGVLRWPT